jgi:hypothetical protein
MPQPARLITPRGKTIELPPDVYRQVLKLLQARNRRQTRAMVDEVVRATYGKYAGGRSLTDALLAERAAERSREDDRPTRRYE